MRRRKAAVSSGKGRSRSPLPFQRADGWLLLVVIIQDDSHGVSPAGPPPMVSVRLQQQTGWNSSSSPLNGLLVLTPILLGMCAGCCSRAHPLAATTRRTAPRWAYLSSAMPLRTADMADRSIRCCAALLAVGQAPGAAAPPSGPVNSGSQDDRRSRRSPPGSPPGGNGHHERLPSVRDSRATDSTQGDTVQPFLSTDLSRLLCVSACS